MVFEGKEIEILTKQDVNLDFQGCILFNAMQVAEILEYKDPSGYIKGKLTPSQKILVENSNITEFKKDEIRKLDSVGEIFIPEKGCMKLIKNSKTLKADKFKIATQDAITLVENNIVQTDLTGKTFGKLRVIERDYSKIKGKVEYYRCECKCGTKDYVTTTKELLSGKRSCGCIRKKKGFNEYKVDGETTTIYFTNKLDEIINEGYIDTEDLQMLIDLDYHWCVSHILNSHEYYARHLEYYTDENGIKQKKSYYLQRLIMGVTDEKYPLIDHIEPKNHGTLNNRKSNLRAVSHEDNIKNRKSKNSNNKSGYRNVSKQGKWWVVQLQIEGKNKILKKFTLDQVDEAGVYAELMRQKYYGEHAGKS